MGCTDHCFHYVIAYILHLHHCS